MGFGRYRYFNRGNGNVDCDWETLIDIDIPSASTTAVQRITSTVRSPPAASEWRLQVESNFENAASTLVPGFELHVSSTSTSINAYAPGLNPLTQVARKAVFRLDVRFGFGLRRSI